MVHSWVSEIPMQLTSTATDFENGHNNEDEVVRILPLKYLIPTVVGVLLMEVLAVGGNILVLMSYATDPGLRTVSNFYLLQLAICDLVIGLSSMTFYLYYTIQQWKWTLGRTVCKIYLVTDYLMCTQSVLLINLISIDQLLILRKGIHYATVETKLKAYVKVSAAWAFSFVLYGPAIIGWDHLVGYSALSPLECDVEFRSNSIYTFITTSIDFVLSLVVLSSVSGKVYLEIQKRSRVNVSAGVYANSNTSRQKISPHEGQYVDANNKQKQGRSVPEVSLFTMKKTGTRQQVITTVPWHPRVAPNVTWSADSIGTSSKKDVTVAATDPATTIQLYSEAAPASNGQTSCQHEGVQPFISKSSTPLTEIHMLAHTQTTHRQTRFLPKPGGKKSCNSAIRKEIKAARALFSLVFVFLVTWAPYSVSVVVLSYCEKCVSEDLLQVFTWLLWFKSSINPFLYAASNVRFRHNFVRIVGKVFVCRVMPCKFNVTPGSMTLT